MKIPFLNNILKKKYTAVAYTRRPEGTPIGIGVQIQLKKDEVDITDTFIFEAKDIAAKHLKGQEIELIIDDDNILSKSVTSNDDDQDSVAQTYPNLNTEDFYVQVLRTADNAFVAVCRKSYVNELIAHFAEFGVAVTAVHLGALQLAVLGKHLNETTVASYNKIALFDNEELVTLQPQELKAEKIYRLQGMYLDATYALPFATLLNGLTQQIEFSGNLIEKNQALAKETKEKNFFKKALQFGLGALLLALTINFLMFNAKYKKSQALQEELQVITSQTKSSKQQQEAVAKKEAIVTSILNTGYSKSSWYTDQVIKRLPTTIQLNSFNYQPLLRTIRPDKSITVQNNTIEISGSTIDKESFTSWLHQIEQLAFVDQLITKEYSENSTNKASFAIEIRIKDDPEE
ncbi:hypothetical protein [Aquimarina brevivitae]|uniref:Fimbrial assembly protein PilN n=1 Tax=Aquimarina brevivitae TaxID=323412 RepID=A0A4Q7NYC2_9FLAO|nr:hypothetical protein [Aquimarina brevivitae]RZS92315.1 hypothetical protein EV197_2953 [Aquimarina brevivitae]